MKRLILSTIVALATFAAASAQKFAMVDMDYILKNVPAYERANEQLNQVSKKSTLSSRMWSLPTRNISLRRFSSLMRRKPRLRRKS